MEMIKANVFQVILGGAMAAISFFVKKTFGSYDKRITDTENAHAQILNQLHKIDKEMTRVATTLEVMTRK